MTVQRVVQVDGLEKVFARLAELRGDKLSNTAQTSMKAALKKTAVPAMKAAAVAAIAGHGHGPNHGPPGRLVKAIDVRAAKKRPGEMFALRVGAAGKRGDSNAWYAHFVVGGTKEHLITPGGYKRGGLASVVRRANRGSALALTVAGHLVSVVHHPGAKAKPFPRSAVGQEHDLTEQITRDLIAASQQGA